MAAAPIEKLSTEVMSMITGLLSMDQLRNLRLACKWSEKKTFNDFTRRGFAEATLLVSHQTVQLSTQVLSSKPLASSLRKLNVEFQEIQIKKTRSGRSEWRRHSSRHHNLVLDTVAVEQIIAQSPNLASIRLGGLTSKGLAAQFCPQSLEHLLATSPATITTLNLVESELTSQEIATVLGGFRKSLKRLIVWQVRSNDGKWRDVLQTIRSLDLEHLQLHVREEGRDAGDGRELTIMESRQKWTRNFRGANGFEHYVIKKEEATMTGRLAVDAGIDLVLSHLNK